MVVNSNLSSTDSALNIAIVISQCQFQIHSDIDLVLFHIIIIIPHNKKHNLIETVYDNGTRSQILSSRF